MSVVFVFTKIMNIEVPINKEIPLEKALLLLDKQNVIAQNQESPMSFSYALRENGIEIYLSSLEFPQENFSLYETINKEIESDDMEGKELFYEWLNVIFSVKKPTKIKQQKSVKEPKKKKEPKVSKRNSHTLKRVLIGFGIIVAAVAITIGGTITYSNFNKVPTLEAFLSNKEFLEAAKEYPSEKISIENELFELIRTKDQQYLKELKQFNKRYPTVQGAFDLAMFDGNYQAATELYDQQEKKLSSDSVRSTLAGYAFLKQKNVAKAEKIQKENNSTELEKYIYNYKQLTRIIQEKEKSIDQLQKEPSKNKKAIEEAIEDLFDAKEQLEDF